MIDLTWDGEIAVVTMDDGENRWSGPGISALHAALDEAEAREGPCGLVVTGTGKFFSNGFDLDWLMANPDAARPFLDEMFRAYARILRFDAPTVAAVNGHAFGAGAMLCTVCDHAVMRVDRGYWCMPEVDLGLPVDDRILSLLLSRLPRRTLTEALVTARRYGGPDAVAAGFADRAVPADEVLTTAIELARSLSGKHRATVGIHKRLIHRDALAVLDPGH
ncbi:MAG: enoyl-CoA hydratase/isomerase family protein [Acidimicrobiales bacterium]|jgi:enoyl-CoA hydratase/carnithine racemase|nr:enoyl-CoA hydratase/isomerase family protein [Acidimicrobiales bacterium]